MVRGQHELLVEQERLQGGQEQMASSLRGNLEQLAQEEALIASGQQQVAQLIEGITRKMGEHGALSHAWCPLASLQSPWPGAPVGGLEGGPKVQLAPA